MGEFTTWCTSLRGMSASSWGCRGFGQWGGDGQAMGRQYESNVKVVGKH